MIMKCLKWILLSILLALLFGCDRPIAVDSNWIHLSSKNGDIPPPGPSTEQTACLVLDVDKNGVSDFIIGSREKGPSVLWYRRVASRWVKYVIDNQYLRIEAGGAFYDIDGDGDLDIVFAVDMFNEGVDLPNVDTILMLRPTESRILWLQQFGL